MDYDTEKVDDATLALMALVVCERVEGYGGRAWKDLTGTPLIASTRRGCLATRTRGRTQCC
jgi:hypothetical protein